MINMIYLLFYLVDMIIVNDVILKNNISRISALLILAKKHKF